MGQKVQPEGFRVGIVKPWKSQWFNDKKEYKETLKQDVFLRELLMEKLVKAGIDRVEIKRTQSLVNVIIYAVRPGFLIGRGGDSIEKIKEDVAKAVKKDKKDKIEIRIQIEQINDPEARARVVAQNIVEMIEKRMPFRRVLKQAVEKTSQAKNAMGVKIMIKGRLDGNEIARTEWLAQGRLPLQTLRADIDYAQATAYTTYGTIGIKVWIYRGDIFEKETKKVTNS